MSTFLQNWMNLRAMSAPKAGGGGSDVVPVEYITRGNSISGINTMLAPTADMDIIVHMVDYVKTAGYGSLFSVSSWGSSQRCLWANGGDQIRAGYGNAPAYAGLYIDISDITFGSDSTFEQRAKDVYINGEYKGAAWMGSFTPESGVTLHIGDNYDYGDECNPNKFGEVLIYDEYGGTLLLDLTPVRTTKAGLVNQAGQTVGADVGGFIDQLTGNLYTATSGSDFVAGPDVA